MHHFECKQALYVHAAKMDTCTPPWTPAYIWDPSIFPRYFPPLWNHATHSHTPPTIVLPQSSTITNFRFALHLKTKSSLLALLNQWSHKNCFLLSLLSLSWRPKYWKKLTYHAVWILDICWGLYLCLCLRSTPFKYFPLFSIRKNAKSQCENKLYENKLYENRLYEYNCLTAVWEEKRETLNLNLKFWNFKFQILEVVCVICNWLTNVNRRET